MPLQPSAASAALSSAPVPTSAASSAAATETETETETETGHVVEDEVGDSVSALVAEEASKPSALLSKAEARTEAEAESVDERQRLAIDKLAAFVARHGDYFEEKTREQYGADERYSFLHEGGAGHEYYRQRLAEMRSAGS